MIHKGSKAINTNFRMTFTRDNSDKMCLSIEDDKSCQKIVNIEMTLEEFAKLVTGLGSRPATGTLYVSDHYGKTHECKRVLVKTEYNKWDFKSNEGAMEEFRSSVAEFEVDGWVGDIKSAFLTQQNNKDGIFVTFRRWV